MPFDGIVRICQFYQIVENSMAFVLTLQYWQSHEILLTANEGGRVPSPELK